MTVELICVGTEILMGNIVNTNAAYLSEKCATLGLSMYHQSVVGDNPQRLGELFAQAAGRSDLVILCGGLGPTQDDLTKETVASVMGRALTEDGRARKEIEEYLSNLSITITENNWKQALVPEGSIVLYNRNGTAPGMIVEGQDVTAILLPGPPNELIPMFEEQVCPYLRRLQPEVICSRMVKLCGVGESAAETSILDLIEGQTNPTIATYAKTGEVHIRISAKAASEQEAYALIDPVERELYERFGSAIFTDREEETLEESIAKLLRENNLTVSTAESCTGGLLAGRLVNVPGISEAFLEGFITYTDLSKRKRLGVDLETLEEYGAVSAETAIEMAEGCAWSAKASIGVSITGIAGPGGGTPEKPVGLVFIGCCYGNITIVEEFQFHGDRDKIRQISVAHALRIMREAALELIAGRGTAEDEP